MLSSSSKSSPTMHSDDPEKALPHTHFAEQEQRGFEHRGRGFLHRMHSVVERIKLRMSLPDTVLGNIEFSPPLPEHRSSVGGDHFTLVPPGFQRSSSGRTALSQSSRDTHRSRRPRPSGESFIAAIVDDTPVKHVVLDAPFDPDEKEEPHPSSRQWSRLTDNEPWTSEEGEQNGSGCASGSNSDRKPSRSRRINKWLFTHVWQSVRLFVYMGFPERERERAFQKDRWKTTKVGTMLGALFLVIYWAMLVGSQEYYVRWTYYAYFAMMGLLTLPLPFLVYFNFPLRFPIIYQLWIAGGCWSNVWVITAEMYSCTLNHACTYQTLEQFLVAVFAIAAIGLISLQANRCFHMFICIAAFAFGAWLYQASTPMTTAAHWRNLIAFLLYHLFLSVLVLHRERIARQLWILQEELRIQYQAVQFAQAMERRAEASKKRFVSYIFHEVRVPLNTARLALSNLDTDGVFHQMPEDQKELVLGLDGSLRMMENVLNDVLSFNRMESGNLMLAQAPFSLHRAVDYIALSHRAGKGGNGLTFDLDLDPRIDNLGLVIGDEMRFKQVCSNFVSNAFKFTQRGGVRLVTRLLYPTASSGRTTPPRRALIRVEIHDTGVGLRAADLLDNSLFSPYVQTEIGRRQGGKGSGLGLALVMQIIKLQKGRLGVDSQPGKGSCFWFEIPYLLASATDYPHSPSSGKVADAAYTAVEEVDQSPPLPDISILPVDRGPYSSPPRSRSQSHRRGPLRPHPNRSHSAPLSPTIQKLGLAPDASPLMEVSPRSEETDQMPALVHPKPLPLAAARLMRPEIERCASGPVRAAAPPSPTLSIQEPLATLSALVVDDDTLTRKLMSRMVAKLGHKVETASNGQIALDLLMRSPGAFDIVFLDNQMPCMTGVEVVRALRTADNPVYVVGCTGNALREDQEQYLDAGADFILPKPVHRAAIEERLMKAVRRKLQEAEEAVLDGDGGEEERGRAKVKRGAEVSRDGLGFTGVEVGDPAELSLASSAARLVSRTSG